MAGERQCSPISNTELARRWSAVRGAMRERGLDALVLQNSNDWLGGYVRWFTGFPANNAYPRAVVFPLEGGMSLVQQGPFGGITELDGSDPVLPGVSRMLTTPSYVSVAYTADYDSALVLEELERGGYHSVGLVAPAAMYYLFGQRLTTTLAQAGVTVGDATEMVDAIKVVKSAEEQALIRQSAAMQDEILAGLCSFIRPGLRDFELAAHAQYLGQTLGSEQGIFLGSSAADGEAATFRPRWQQGRQIARGDMFMLLIENSGPGAMYTEMARPIVLGKVTPKQRDAWTWILEAQRVTLEALKPGIPCAQVFATYNAFLRASGRPEERRLHTHGQGYDLVERPLIRDDETMTVAEGMNFAVHPSFMDGTLFMAVCDNYLIGAGGAGEPLHRTPKEIIEV